MLISRVSELPKLTTSSECVCLCDFVCKEEGVDVLIACVSDVVVVVDFSQAGAEISTVNPEQYSKRFYEFMSNILS